MLHNSNEKFVPERVIWSSETLLADISPPQFVASEELRQKVHHDLWGDMCAEYDAENLWAYLCSNGYFFSRPFMDSLDHWRADERNHYIGLRAICSMMYGISEPEIDMQMARRVPDFTGIEYLMEDEFHICVVLAYDELVSARGYRMFYDDFKQFGPPEVFQWVRWASRDEALHYKNFLAIVEKVHPHRLDQLPAAINQIREYENRPGMTYNATFLLDHTEETFSRSFLNNCTEQILNVFGMRSASRPS